MKKFFKLLGAAAIGGAISSASAVQIDPAHMKSSGRALGQTALTGALIGVGGLLINFRSLKEQQEQEEVKQKLKKYKYD